jgi:lipopolysaccharide export system permease protein
MPIIDRYLLWQFTRVFLICFCSLTGLFAVFDAFNNLDEFLNFAHQHGSLVQVIGEYYGYRSIALFDRMSGVLGLTSAMFTLTWFQRFNELTALSAAGIPPARIISPIISAAIAISLLAAASRELVIPRLQDELSRSAKDLAGDQAQELKPRYDNETDILIRGRQTFANEQRILRPDFLLPPSLDAYGRKLVAGDAYYRPPQGGRPGGYLLKGVSAPKNLAERPSLKLGDKLVLLTPMDHPWLEPDQCFVASEVNFEQLTGGIGWRYFSSTLTLIRGLRNRSLDFGADVRVTIHSRFVKPILDVTLLFLGLPLLLSRNQRNIFVSIGLCVLVTSGFMLVVFGAQHLGSAYLISPVLGAWLPLMIFVPVAVVLSEPLLV